MSLDPTIQLRVCDVAKAFGGLAVGKTTLLRIVAGFERADRGSVWLQERLVCGPGVHEPPERRHIGYVPQEGALFPHLNVLDNVAFGLPRGARRSPRVRDMLALVELGDLGARMPHELSGGQQQRVALARALAPEPSVVLLDEPFSGLDAGLRSSLRADVKRVLAALGSTVVLVTHDQTEALSLADEVAVMRDGQLVQRCDPLTLYWEPTDLDVARFLGEANVLPAVRDGASARCALGTLPVRNAARIAGDQVQVLIRPEQIVCGTLDGVPAEVVSVVFLGQAVLISLALDGILPRTALLSLAPGHDVPAPGAHVRLGVSGSVTAYPLPPNC
jgi:iron(III) transport system ATP-binding protein